MVQEEISQIIEDTAKSLGYLIYDFSIYLKGENTRINIKIDSIAGISHLDCENFSRELTGRLEREDILPNYSIEVSSPGIKRLVRNGNEFRRFFGAPVKVVCVFEGNSTVIKGRIGEVTETSVMILSNKEERAIPLATITRANLDY